MQRPSIWTIMLGGCVLVFLILPNVVIVPLSFSATEYFEFPPRQLSLQWYARFFADPTWTDALIRSLRIGVACAFVSSVLGVSAAFTIVRGAWPYRALLVGLLLAPLVVPQVILAAGLFVFYVDLGLLRTEFGLILAHTLIATPVVILAVMVSVRSLRRDLELAAMSLGAGYAQTFFRVMLPQITPGVLTGAVLAFVSSFDETTLAIFLGGSRTSTLPLKMWEGITVESNPVLPAASTILLIGSTIPLILVNLCRRWRERSAVRPASAEAGAH
jgi:ABC-type spermidine/putrescine transport system permease subunit II